MVPFIIGGVTLAAIGYGVSKCLTDEEYVDNLKDKIQDHTFTLYEAIERLEEKVGLNSITLENDDYYNKAQTVKKEHSNANSTFSVPPYRRQINPTEGYRTSEAFYVLKKSIFEEFKEEYKKYTQFENAIKNINTEIEIEQEMFDEGKLSNELSSYIRQISQTLEVLSYNFTLTLKLVIQEKKIDEETNAILKNYTNSIYNLTHMTLFKQDGSLNNIEILSSLVKAMELSVKKDSIHIELDLGKV